MLAREQDLALNVVTQFSFAPDRIANYCADLQKWGSWHSCLRRIGGSDQSNAAAALRKDLWCKHVCSRSQQVGV